MVTAIQGYKGARCRISILQRALSTVWKQESKYKQDADFLPLGESSSTRLPAGQVRSPVSFFRN